MISRLMQFIICPECHHPNLSCHITKTGNKVSVPFQQFNISEYFKYRDMPNQNLLLKWIPNNNWITWPDNPDYIINTGTKTSLKGEIISKHSGLCPIHLKGIFNSTLEIILNNKKIGTFHTDNNDLLDNIPLGTHLLSKGVNIIELKPIDFDKTNYIHQNHIDLNQKSFNKPIVPINNPSTYQDITEGIITCKKCLSKFPIIDGIPLLLKRYLLKTYFENRKIPNNLLNYFNFDSEATNHDKGKNYKISEISIGKNKDLPTGFFESFKHHPFIPHDPQRSQEKLLSFSLLVFLLNPKANEIILDSAVGAGWTSGLMSKLGCEVIATDINFDYLKEGHKNSKESFFHRIVCDSENIPIKKRSVDSIFSYDSFHHMPNKIQCIHNFHNILKYGGRMVFYEPKAIHNSNYFSQTVMDKYSILEEGFTGNDFRNYLNGLDFKEPLFHNIPYFKDTHIITVDKIGYKNATSLSPGILKAAYSIQKISKQKNTVTLNMRIRNSGNTAWLYSRTLSTIGATYIKVIASDNMNSVLFEQIIALKSHVLPSTEFSQKIILKNKLVNRTQHLEIDLMIYDLIDFKNAHGSSSFTIEL